LLAAPPAAGIAMSQIVARVQGLRRDASVVRHAAVARSEQFAMARSMRLMKKTMTKDTKDTRIYTTLVGTWMVVLLGFGVLSLLGVFR
jgi:hypothetical protein